MSTEESESLSLPEDLPPVEPPSAGFILQLFLIPGLIVAVVFGVWCLVSGWFVGFWLVLRREGLPPYPWLLGLFAGIVLAALGLVGLFGLVLHFRLLFFLSPVILACHMLVLLYWPKPSNKAFERTP